MIITLIMHLALCAHIIFPATDSRGALQVKRVNAIHIEKSWKNLTDKGHLIMPRNTYWKKDNLKDLVKKGDPIIVLLGYDGVYNEEFVGFVTQVSAGIPVKIEFEDNMWRLKQVPVTKSYREVNLQKLIKDIVPSDIPTDVADIGIGAFSADKATVAVVLKKLQDAYKLYSYFKGDTLVVGKIYTDDTKTVKLHFEKNIKTNDLTFKSRSDEKIKVTATSLLSNGSKITATVGDAIGQENELSYFNITSQGELKKLAQNDLDRLKRDGWEGSIALYGIPYCTHGMKVALTSGLYPERNGTYYIDGETIDFDISPKFERKIELGPTAS